LDDDNPIKCYKPLKFEFRVILDKIGQSWTKLPYLVVIIWKPKCDLDFYASKLPSLEGLFSNISDWISRILIEVVASLECLDTHYTKILFLSM